MSPSSELDLVYQAIRSRVTGCCEWDDGEALRVREDTSLQGLSPEYIRTRLQEYVLQGGLVQQIPEQRSAYSHRSYYYKAIIPEAGFKNGLFVEMELTDNDPDLPCVTMLNAHPQSK